MTKTGLILRSVMAAGAVTAGWFTAPFWQAQPSVRSAVRLLFRPAAEGGGAAAGGVLTLNGITVSLAEADGPGPLRAMLERIREAAFDATPQDAEKFLIALMDQLSSLPPENLRSLALALARDRDLLNLLDQTTRAVSTRLLSKDLEMHLSLELAKVIQRDPDRMLLLAEALPPSRTRDEFLGRMLTILAVDRPEEVLALLNGPDMPLKGGARSGVLMSALQTLAARSFTGAAETWKKLEDSEKWETASVLLDRVNEEPDPVFAWLEGLPEPQRKHGAFSAMFSATPDVVRRWLTAHPSPAAGDDGAFLMACGQLAKADPAAAMTWLAKLPALEDSRELAGRISLSMSTVPVASLLTAIPGMPPENQARLLTGALGGSRRTVGELAQLAATVSDPAVQERMAKVWSQQVWDKWAVETKEVESLPPGALRGSALTALGEKWSRLDPQGWLAWLRTAPAADQTAAMAKADPKVWAEPENAAFLTTRPAAEQLPWLAGIYHHDARAAAAVIERASAQGAGGDALDAAAKSLAQSWQNRDPATARAFALSLPDPLMADSVLLSLAADSATAEARAAATAAIQDPVNRRKAERAAALRDAGIIQGPPVKK
ncbi:MAG: hypothetical protein V4726_05905 [Verrucomicrobiota bacterium]